jgi:fructokinase
VDDGGNECLLSHEALTPVSDARLYGAIEGGGTKFVCAVARSANEILESTVIATRASTATLGDCVDFFESAQQRYGEIAAFGFSCFGPLDLRRNSSRYGHMMSTPKPGWSRVNVLSQLRQTFAVPIALATDVVGAALAEWQLGAGRDCGSLAYVTVGTGIGAAVVPESRSASRLMHAEMGHIPVRRDARDGEFTGLCPFHSECLEGLASGPTIQARWKRTLDTLPADHCAWSIIGGYLGQLAAVIALTHSVERVVFGGGVMTNRRLLSHVRTWTSSYLNGYLEPLNEPDRWTSYICTSALGDRAGLVGSVLLAMSANENACQVRGKAR